MIELLLQGEIMRVKSGSHFPVLFERIVKLQRCVRIHYFTTGNNGYDLNCSNRQG